jgi:hypothetical protein
MINMAGFEDLLLTGKQVGIFDFYLPFVLSFAVVYGILRKAKIFGEDKVGRTVDLILSVILSLFVIGGTTVGATIATFFGTMFTGTVMLIVTLLGTIMVLYVLGKTVGITIPGKQGEKKWAVALIAITLLLAAGIFASSGGLSFFGGVGMPSISFPLPALPSVTVTVEDMVIFGAFALLLATIWYLAAEEKGGKAAK